MTIKFVDLAAQNHEVRRDIQPLIDNLHDATAYVGGAQVLAFEQAFAAFLGVRHVTAVSSGTDALRLALHALGVGPGNSVITTPMTFIATAAAIAQTGARPVFVDIDPRTGNLSPQAVERYLKSHQRDSVNAPLALLPVDLYGLPAALSEFRALADAYKLKLIEDACQAHGARLRHAGQWQMAGGALADAACFSFYPGKNLGAWGEGGAVATNDDSTAQQVLRLRDHGRVSHYEHDILGYNARLDSLQAAVLTVKLARLANWNLRRRQIAALYQELLAETELELPQEPEGSESCYHLYVVRTRKRDRISEALTAADIGCGIHYPIPLHLQPALRFLGYRAGDLPCAEHLADTVFSLPIHPHLSDDAVAQVATVVRGALN